MKNLLKIGALSFALIAVVFMMSTKAANDTGDLKLLINGETGSCEYGTDLDFGEQNFNYSGYNLTGDFLTTLSGIQWHCTDTLGKSDRVLSVAVSGVVNTTTNNPAHTIPVTRVFLQNSAVHQASGFFAEWTGETNNWSDFSVSHVLMEKVSAEGDIGRLAVDDVNLAINIADSQALGQYVGTITISVPTLD